jgi:hypothetical protein
MTDALPATVSNISEAKLPATYEAARTAIAECERIDEVKGWADKAAALASYARQANDDSLRVMAVRIQDRAMRRAGELLKLIPAANGANQNIRGGTVLKVTRTAAATDAGLSERQHKTAIRVASIPAVVFDAQVESKNPPTVTQLAEQGKVTRLRDPKDSQPAVNATCQAIRVFAQFTANNDAAELAQAVTAEEAQVVREMVTRAGRWLTKFWDNLPVEIASDRESRQP